jgi:hypothetical protein
MHRKRTSQRKRKNAKKTGIKQRGGTTSVYYKLTPFKPTTKNTATTIHLTTETYRPTMEEKKRMFNLWTADPTNSSLYYKYFFGEDMKHYPSFHIDNNDSAGSFENPVQVEIYKIDPTLDPRTITGM